MISIIVPVYNAEKYLDKCVSSILLQTHKDLELILVDDGSPDKSGAMCDEWAKKDNRITVIHQPNSGVSVARNNGIAAAKGDYIAFVDSDDTVKEDWLSDLLTLNNNFDADIITFGVERISDGQVIATESMPTFYANNRKELSPHFCQFYNDIFGSVCAKIYKASIIRENNITFDPTLALNEDAFFDYAFIPYAFKFINCENCYYQYYFYSDSSSNKGREDMIEVFLRRQPVHDEFVKKMGYENLGLPTGEDMLQIGIYLQYIQAVTSTNSLSFTKRIRLLKRLYSSSMFKTYILNEMDKQPSSFALKLGALSIRLNCPYFIAIPVVLKKLFHRDNR